MPVCVLWQVSRSKTDHVHLADESIFFLPEADESSSVSGWVCSTWLHWILMVC